MAHRNIAKTLIALLCGASTTVGQCFLISIFVPVLIAAHGFWLLLGLLCFNCGVAVLVLLSSET
jgi:hypothetical protein